MEHKHPVIQFAETTIEHNLDVLEHVAGRMEEEAARLRRQVKDARAGKVGFTVNGSTISNLALEMDRRVATVEAVHTCRQLTPEPAQLSDIEAAARTLVEVTGPLIEPLQRIADGETKGVKIVKVKMGPGAKEEKLPAIMISTPPYAQSIVERWQALKLALGGMW